VNESLKLENMTGSQSTEKKLKLTFPPGKRASFQKMLEECRAAKCRSERTNLSQQIRSHIRRYIRARSNKRETAILVEFVDLNQFDAAVREPVVRERRVGTQRTAKQFKEFLGNIFQSAVGQQTSWLEQLWATVSLADFIYPTICQSMNSGKYCPS
jgi:hypothetical protein